MTDEAARKAAQQLLDNLNQACGLLCEAAMHATAAFDDEDERRGVRRELGRLMTMVDSRIIPVLKPRYPDLAGYLLEPESSEPG